jgi:hypothetical protein
VAAAVWWSITSCRCAGMSIVCCESRSLGCQDRHQSRAGSKRSFACEDTSGRWASSELAGPATMACPIVRLPFSRTARY